MRQPDAAELLAALARIRALPRCAGPHPLATALPLFDRKRAAAGDRED